jgi:hypothetical protein
MEERLALGFEAAGRALKRAKASAPEQRFAPLAETLMWLVILNDAFWEDNENAYKSHRDADSEGQLIEGLRYARHRLVHDIRVYGMHGVIYRGGDFSPADFDHRDFYVGRPVWTWRKVDELDPAENTNGEAVYRERLEGREVLPILKEALGYLEKYRTVWHPISSPGAGG